MTAQLKASVVIPTRDRAKLLEKCLESLTRQTFPADQFEVLIVDNGTGDQTRRLADAYASRLTVQYVPAPEPGLHVGRHAGMRRAQTDILTFADDDIEAEPGWVEAVVSAFDDPEVVLVGGNNYPLFEQRPPDWLSRWWNRPVYRGRALTYLSILDFGNTGFDIDPGYVWGCNYSIRRDMLIRAGGFHPDGMPTDRLRFRGDGETHVSDCVRASGQRAIFEPGASVHHLVSQGRMTPDYFCRRAYAQGISDSYSRVRKANRARWSAAVVKWRLRQWSGSAYRLAENLVRKSDPVERELWAIRAKVRRAYRDGFLFHQRSVRADPDLCDWVLKESYL